MNTRFEAPAKRCKFVVLVVSRLLIAQCSECGGALLLCVPDVVVRRSNCSSRTNSSVDCSSLSPSSEPSSSGWLESPVSSSLIKTKLDKPITLQKISFSQTKLKCAFVTYQYLNQLWLLFGRFVRHLVCFGYRLSRSRFQLLGN